MSPLLCLAFPPAHPPARPYGMQGSGVLERASSSPGTSPPSTPLKAPQKAAQKGGTAAAKQPKDGPAAAKQPAGGTEAAKQLTLVVEGAAAEVLAMKPTLPAPQVWHAAWCCAVLCCDRSCWGPCASQLPRQRQQYCCLHASARTRMLPKSEAPPPLIHVLCPHSTFLFLNTHLLPRPVPLPACCREQ